MYRGISIIIFSTLIAIKFKIFEKIPIELCKRKRLDEETVFLEKGKVFRKEGEKRRKKIGNRAAAEGNFFVKEYLFGFYLPIFLQRETKLRKEKKVEKKKIVLRKGHLPMPMLDKCLVI